MTDAERRDTGRSQPLEHRGRPRPRRRAGRAPRRPWVDHPGRPGGAVHSAIVVPEQGVVRLVAVSVDIAHTYIGDLSAPSCSRRRAPPRSSTTARAAAGATSSAPGTAPPRPAWRYGRPRSPASGAGRDLAPRDSGTLRSWSLRIELSSPGLTRSLRRRGAAHPPAPRRVDLERRGHGGDRRPAAERRRPRPDARAGPAPRPAEPRRVVTGPPCAPARRPRSACSPAWPTPPRREGRPRAVDGPVGPEVMAEEPEAHDGWLEARRRPRRGLRGACDCIAAAIADSRPGAERPLVVTHGGPIRAPRSRDCLGRGSSPSPPRA